MDLQLKPFWRRYFSFNWKFGLFLILLVCIPRFVLVLQANASGSYGAIGLIMLLSALAPFIFLTRSGRREIGMVGTPKYRVLLLAFVCGLIASLALYFLGKVLFGQTDQNWYRYIGRSYKIPALISEKDKMILFSVMALTGMTFSPIGEELFFRGMVHNSFAHSFGERKASMADASAFALTHISHFGFVYLNGKWDFFILPTLLWVISMFLVSLLFFRFRQMAGSILGAIICHAAFNLGMIASIFYGF